MPGLRGGSRLCRRSAGVGRRVRLCTEKDNSATNGGAWAFDGRSSGGQITLGPPFFMEISRPCCAQPASTSNILAKQPGLERVLQGGGRVGLRRSVGVPMTEAPAALPTEVPIPASLVSVNPGHAAVLPIAARWPPCRFQPLIQRHPRKSRVSSVAQRCDRLRPKRARWSAPRINKEKSVPVLLIITTARPTTSC